jgi:CheY-like chemotaxis protein
MGGSPFGALSDVLVLVVEDNPDSLNILQSLLSYLGAFVSAAATAQQALSILAQVKVDVVVCDVNLGDQDALWLIEQVRPHQPTTPFIAISGQDYDEHEMRLAGFSASLTKPLRHDLLVHMILEAVGR